MREEYALVKDSIVTNIIVIEDATNEILENFKNTFNVDIIVKVERELIGVGATWDGEALWPYIAFPSWVKNNKTKEWEAPVPYPQRDPQNPVDYIWNEEILNWEEVSE